MALNSILTSGSFHRIALKLEWRWTLFDAGHFNEAHTAHTHLKYELEIACVRLSPASGLAVLILLVLLGLLLTQIRFYGREEVESNQEFLDYF